MSKGAAAISIILAAILGFVVGSIATQTSRGPNVSEESNQAANGSARGGRMQDAERIPVGNSPVLGPNNALVTIVEFSDFQCPFCSRVEDTVRQIRQRYGNDVRLVWKNAPLPFHDRATPAAEAAMAANAQGKFWEMHDILYQNQRALADADLERYAQQIGLDMNRFRADMQAHRYTAAIDADKALAQRVNAQGTPNFFINGTQLVGAQPMERFTALIDQVLARARTITPRERVYAEMVANPVTAPDAPQQPSPQQPQQPRQELDPNTVYRVPVGNSPARGPADALVTIVEFSDFQCPFCSRVEPTLQQIVQRYGNDVRIVWKNMPLEFHDKAMPAAEAAMEAFAQQGNQGFWRMHDTLYQHQADQGGLDRPALERYAQEQGLNMARFRAALDQHTHQAEIRADMQLAQQIAANGTPHFFINGKRLVGAQPLDRFTAAIDAARTEAQNLVAQQHVARNAVYERITGNGATSPVYQNNGAAPGAQPGAQPGGNPADRVYTIAPNPRAPFRGNANARVVIEHFSDFQCPFCSRVNPALDQIAQTYGDRVKIVWRNYPLGFHQNAMPAAEAAMEAFAQQGNAGFWRYHDTLFQNQQALTRADLERYAQQQGLNMERFRAALDNHTHQAEIQADQHVLDGSGAEAGTPASFINGHFVSGAQPFAAFQTVIDAELARAGGGARGAAPAPTGARPAAAPAH
jgi:protein-disulfide isomerase